MLCGTRASTQTSEDRIGALFWRMHRCARIIFSLSFQLNQMTPEQAVDLLVDEVGHERANAIAEVRRSVDGSYDPLYQCAYLVGALQFMALHRELVDSGKMTDRQYNDAILHEGRMPVEMLRAILTSQKLTPDFEAHGDFWTSRGHRNSPSSRIGCCATPKLHPDEIMAGLARLAAGFAKDSQLGWGVR